MALHQKTAGNIDFHCDIKLESDWFTCYLVRVFNVNKHLTLTVLLERGKWTVWFYLIWFFHAVFTLFC